MARRRVAVLAARRPRMGTKACENAPGKQASQQVRMREGDVEGVGRGAGAEGRGDDQFAGETGDARAASVNSETVDAARSRFIDRPAAGRERIFGDGRL